MPSLGEAVVEVGADTSGFQKDLEQGVSSASNNAAASLKNIGSKTTDVGKKMALGITTPLVGIAVAAVNTQKQFEQSMNLLEANVSGATDESIASLSDLAKQLGAETVFSANEAADAMLELAKGGMNQAQIAGGGVQATMALAATEGLDLADAATITSNAMNSFGIEADKASSIADALAGASAASSASVQSLSQALSQVGPGATNAGLSLQDTVGTLAAFDQAGIKGSDAGTSLKTMLTRLVPQTKGAENAMRDLGLEFVNSDGSMKSITQIAGQMQKGFKGLTQEQRTTAMNTIFGSDATRAATVLMNEGSKGLAKYIRATQESGKAQELADARMSGTAGALEKMSGAIETAMLSIGEAIAPVVVQVADKIAFLAEKFTNLPEPVQKIIVVIGAIAAAIGPALIVIGMLISAVGTIAGVFAAASAAVIAPIIAIVAAIALIGFALVKAWQTMPEFRAQVMTVFNQIKDLVVGTLIPAFQQLANFFMTTLVPIVQQAFAVFSEHVLPVLVAVVGFVTGTLIPAIMKIVVAVASNLAPVFKTLVDVFRAQLLPILAKVADKFMEWWPTIKKVIMIIVTLIGWVLVLAAKILGVLLPPLIKFAAFLIGTVVNAIIAVISVLITIISWVIKVGTAFVNAVKDIAHFVSSAGAKIGEFIGKVAEIPGKVKSALSGAAGWLVSVGSDMIRGLINGVKAMAGQVADAAKSVVKGAVDAAKSALHIGSPSKVFEEIGDDVGKGFVKGIVGSRADVHKAFQDLVDDVRRTSREGLQKLVLDTRAQLEHLGKRYGEITRHLENAKDALADLRQEATDFSANVVSGAMALGDLTSFVDEEGVTSFDQIVAGMTKANESVAAFNEVIQQLSKAGLDDTLLQQLIEKGPAEGMDAAQAILASGAEGIGQLNALQTQLTTSSAALAQTAHDELFKAGIDAGQGLVDGLETQQGKIVEKMKTIAEEMVKAIKKALKIKSPSALFEQFGGLSGEGLARGLAASGPKVKNEVTRLVQLPARPPAPSMVSLNPGDLAQLNSGRASNANINVQLPTGDPEAAAQAVMNRLATTGRW